MKNPRLLFTKQALKDVKEYNASLPEIPQGIQDLQARMLLGSGWTQDDGPFPGVFDARGCLWSVQWHTSGGVIGPRKYWPLEVIPVQAMVFEFLEYCQLESQPGKNSGRESKNMQFLLDLRRFESGQMGVPHFMRTWLPELSGPTRQFICTFDPPDMTKIIMPNYRAGWPTKGNMLPPVSKQIHVPEGWRIAR